MSIKLVRLEDVYFTSDTHFGHRAMVEKWRRLPENVGGGSFIDKDHMDTFLIGRWNATVPPYGIVFHLGDFSFRNSSETLSILTQLNGEIHLTKGNHDGKFTSAIRSIFRTINDYLELRVSAGPYAAQRIVLSHYPLQSWNGMHHGAWHIHGHSHGNLVSSGKRLDVGIDCNLVTPDLRPLSFQEVADYMALQNFVAVDHHYKEGDPQFDRNEWTREVAGANNERYISKIL